MRHPLPGFDLTCEQQIQKGPSSKVVWALLLPWPVTLSPRHTHLSLCHALSREGLVYALCVSSSPSTNSCVLLMLQGR